MSRCLAMLAAAALLIPAGAAAQDPGVAVRPFDQKRGGQQVGAHAGPRRDQSRRVEGGRHRDRAGSRPALRLLCGFVNFDVQIYDISNPAAPKKIYRLDDRESGAPPRHRRDGRQVLQDRQQVLLRAVATSSCRAAPTPTSARSIFDVTGLPDRARSRSSRGSAIPPSPGGFHNIFAYKHSDGRALYFATINQTEGAGLRSRQGRERRRLRRLARRRRAESDAVQADRRRRLPRLLRRLRPGHAPGQVLRRGARRLFGVGRDASRAPTQLFTITSLGMDIAHTFTPSPDGRYAVTETEYQYTPLRDLGSRARPDGQDAEHRPRRSAPGRPTGATWRTTTRCAGPTCSSSAYEDGFQVFDLKDPKHPKTDGWFYTCECEHEHGLRRHSGQRLAEHDSVEQGAFGVDVRNYDGLIVISDMRSGLWMFQLDGFNGWNGHDYGMPNISSVQDYDHGPVVASPPAGGTLTRPVITGAGRGSRRWRRASSLLSPGGPFDIALHPTRRQRPDAQGHARLVSAALALRRSAVTADGTRATTSAYRAARSSRARQPGRVHGLRRLGRDAPI